MGERMKAITVRPPWSQIIAESAALAALGIEPKTVENRGRYTSYRGPVAIHAGRTWDRDGGSDPRVMEAWAGFACAIRLREPNPKLAAIGDRRTGFVGALKVPSLWIEQGAVIAVADLVDCHEATVTGRLLGSEPCCRPWGAQAHGDRAAYHLVLGEVRRLRDPVPCAGQLAVPWTLPEDVTAQVTAQLAVGSDG
jgi:hypothetical protein